jgi:hypothetical protein
MTSVPSTLITLFSTPVTGTPYADLKILKYFGLIRHSMKCIKKSDKQAKIAKHKTAPGIKAPPATRKETFTVQKKSLILFSARREVYLKL